MLQADPPVPLARFSAPDLKKVAAHWFGANRRLSLIQMVNGKKSFIFEGGDVREGGRYDEDEWVRYQRDDYLPCQD